MTTNPAALVRQTYIDCYCRHRSESTGVPCKYNSGPRWDGGTDGRGRRYQPIWPRIVEYAQKNGVADLEAFVRAQFELPAGLPPPYPTTFLAPTALARYRQFLPSMRRRIRTTFAMQLSEASRLYQSAMALYGNHPRAVLSVLLSSGTSISALFRFCLAVREELYDEAAVWADAAAEQYHRDRTSYDAIWGDFLPPGCEELLPLPVTTEPPEEEAPQVELRRRARHE